MTFKRVVVTGLGALTPIGNDVATYWNNLAAGVSGAGPITKFDASKFRTQICLRIERRRRYAVHSSSGSP